MTSAERMLCETGRAGARSIDRINHPQELC
jgi:hypothetical protein